LCVPNQLLRIIRIKAANNNFFAPAIAEKKEAKLQELNLYGGWPLNLWSADLDAHFIATQFLSPQNRRGCAFKNPEAALRFFLIAFSPLR